MFLLFGESDDLLSISSPGAKVQVVPLLGQEEQASQRQQQRPRSRARHGRRQVSRHQLPLILWPAPTERGECVILCVPALGSSCFTQGLGADAIWLDSSVRLI